MNIPPDLKYTDSHEWMRAEADGTVTIGITDHAQAALGDLVFVELPAVGRDARRPAKPAPSSSRSRPPPTSTRRSPARWSPSTTRVTGRPEALNADAYARLALPREAGGRLTRSTACSTPRRTTKLVAEA